MAILLSSPSPGLKACPVILSIDANFGLCQRKAAGSSIHEPLSGTTMFFNQHNVNEFIANYGSTSLTSYTRRSSCCFCLIC